MKTAFLHGELEEDLFVRLPEGQFDEAGRVWKLNKSLYGLKQAPRQWYLKIRSILQSFGLVQSLCDSCVFYGQGTNRVILILYVDDGLLMSKSEENILNFLERLQSKIEIKSGPLKYYLGLRIERNSDLDVIIHQEKYIRETLEKFQMTDCKSVSIPIERTIYSEDNSEPADDKPYRHLIGSLMYLTVCSRPDITFAVYYLSRFLNKPTKKLWSAALRVLRYLKGTMKFGIRYSSSETDSYRFYSDSDFASDGTDRKSTSGFLIYGNNGPIIWSSTKQNFTSLSTMEAELASAVELCRTSIWFKRLLAEVGYEIRPKILIDNQATLALLKDQKLHRRAKHIDTRYFFFKEKIEDEVVETDYVPTEENLSDIFTKPLTRDRYQKLRTEIGIKQIDKD